MAMRYRRSSEDDESAVDITPMIDIVFIMLIFFIVTASFVKESGMDINRPPPSEAQVKEERGNILVIISAQDEVVIDGRQVDPRALRANIERMHAENPQGTLVIAADKNSTNKLLVKVMDAARLAGVSEIAMAANTP